MEAAPGQVPVVLADTGERLFRADERVFEAMLDGCRALVAPRA